LLVVFFVQKNLSAKIVQKFVRIIGHEKTTLSKKAVRPAHLLDMQQMSFLKHSIKIIYYVAL